MGKNGLLLLRAPDPAALFRASKSEAEKSFHLAVDRLAVLLATSPGNLFQFCRGGMGVGGSKNPPR